MKTLKSSFYLHILLIFRLLLGGTVNRRTYLKAALALGTFGAASLSLFKWFDLNRQIDASGLWAKKAIIAELAEMIIPRTDTPGARDANVQNYIISVILNCNPVRQQHKFFYGLEDLEKYAKDQYGKEFMDCDAIQKLEVLTYSSQNAEYSSRILNKINNKFFGQSFFSKLKALTVEGYCLSMLGATQGLAYDYIPGKYEACIPLQMNQKSWATK
jgi:hypothetical protein